MWLLAEDWQVIIYRFMYRWTNTWLNVSRTCNDRVEDSGTLTRWVPYDGYIRHQNDHLSGRMTDISVMGEWQVADVGRTRPLENVLGEALKGRFSFETRNYLFSFQSYVRFEEFFCFPRFWKIWRQTFKLWGFWFRRCLGGLFENSAPSPGSFLRTPTTWTTTTSIFLKISFLFPKQSRCYLPDRYGDPQAEQSTLMMEHRRQEWKLDFRALARPSAEGPWIVVAIGTSRVRRSMVQKRKKKNKEVSVWLCEGSTLYHLQTRKFWGACFRDPMSLPFRTSLFSWVWMSSCRTVRLQRGGKRRKAVIRDTSGIDHWGVTNLSAPISIAGQGHCTVFRHVMQLSLLVLCWKSTLAVILPEIKKKRSLSNVGHRGTKAENMAWHSTG